jgi:HEAT repeat protein
MLRRPGPLRVWGLLLAARSGAAVDAADLTCAIARVADPREIAALVECLSGGVGSDLVPALLDLYLRLPPEVRGELADVLSRHGDAVAAWVEAHPELPAATRLVLDSLAGASTADLALAPEAQAEAVGQLLDRRDLLHRMAWRDWLERDAELWGPLAAAAAAKAELGELLPALRGLVDSSPSPPVVRALGELGDRDGVEALCRLAEREPHFLPLVLESLGEIGGREARLALRSALGGDDEVVERVAFRALAFCATEEEEPLFRQAVTHADWNVRLAAAMVLGRSARAENLLALGQLAADPVAIVSQRALSYLES